MKQKKSKKSRSDALSTDLVDPRDPYSRPSIRQNFPDRFGHRNGISIIARSAFVPECTLGRGPALYRLIGSRGARFAALGTHLLTSDGQVLVVDDIRIAGSAGILVTVLSDAPSEGLVDARRAWSGESDRRIEKARAHHVGAHGERTVPAAPSTRKNRSSACPNLQQPLSREVLVRARRLAWERLLARQVYLQEMSRLYPAKGRGARTG